MTSTSVIIALILIVLALAVGVAMVIVQKWEEVFITLSIFIAALAIINGILILFGVY